MKEIVLYKKIFKKIQENSTDFSKEEINLINSFIDDGIIIKNNTYELNSKYKIAIVRISQNIAILEDLVNEHKNSKISLENLNGAYDGDLVIAKRIFNPRQRNKAEVIKILESKKTNILVYVKEKSFFTMKENIRLNSKNASNFKEGDILLINNNFTLIKNLGNIDKSSIDELISLYLYEEEYRLDKPLATKTFSMNKIEDRKDLRHLPFCTIDPNSAKDFDDAIYYDENEKVLYVAIADVSYFVKEDTILDKLAFKKSTSAYFPSKVLPMLPKELSEDLCSLKEGLDRYAFVFKIYLDLSNVKVKKSEYFEAIINSHRRFTYGRIDRVLDGKFDQYSQTDKKIFDYLLPLYNITKIYKKQRLKKGYDFRSKENRLKLKNDELQSIEVETSTASHQLVEECMLLANIEASKNVQAKGIFRIHEEPSFKVISKLIEEINILGLNVKLKSDVHNTIKHIQDKAKNFYLREEVDELLIQAQTQAKYSSINQGHFGLGFSSYSHFTSPIRRYSDLILHRILKNKKLPSNIEEICEYISNNERKINMMIWDFEDRKYARWANKHIGLELKVKIIDTTKAKAICYSKMIGLKVIIENYKGQKLFSKLKVTIKSVNIFTKEIFASIKY